MPPGMLPFLLSDSGIVSTLLAVPGLNLYGCWRYELGSLRLYGILLQKNQPLSKVIFKTHNGTKTLVYQ